MSSPRYPDKEALLLAGAWSTPEPLNFGSQGSQPGPAAASGSSEDAA